MLHLARHSSHVLLDILNDLNGMFFRCDLRNNLAFCFATRGSKKLTGYSPEELIADKSISLNAFIYEKDGEVVMRECLYHLERNELCEHEFRVVDRSGKIKKVRGKSAGVYNEWGQAEYIEGYIAEVTDLQDKETLTKELELYRNAINLNTICSITDRRGKIIYANDKFCEVSGYPEQELVGATHRLINSGYHPPEFFREMWQTISAGKVWNGEIRNRARDGEVYWVDSLIIPVKDDEGRIFQFLSLRQVITEKKLAEEKNILHIRALEKVLFMISHELRQPVATTLGLIHLLETPKVLDADETIVVLGELKTKVLEIDTFTRKLTDFIHEHKILRE